MKNILIIYPHWPPSNLAGVHRPRLIANFLPKLGWHPIVLTVHSRFYEEAPDEDILKTVAQTTEIHYTSAFPIWKIRLLGDIGLRAFFQLYTKALKIIDSKKVDFIWIPIPSFYVALLGRMIFARTGIPYGIDYIDPWVRDISNRKNWRAKLSLCAARILEPIAIKKASLISGVSENYFLPAVERNFKLHKPVLVSMPYGFDPQDHQIVLDAIKLPWADVLDVKPIVYAGAFLPNSGYFLDLIFSRVASQLKNGDWDKTRHFYFLGTGSYRHKSISEYAREHQISDYVHEIRERYPFLHILNFLSNADKLLVLGSTEAHYTASKIFQTLLSKRPVFAVFHHLSSACNIMQECGANMFLCSYNPNRSSGELASEIEQKWNNFLTCPVWMPDLNALNKYSALQSANELINAVLTCISSKK